MIDPPLRYLTKSLVRTALTCPRKLAYASNPKLYPRNDKQENDPFVKHLTNEGRRFGDYCRSLFPHGVEVAPTDSMISEASQDSDSTLLEKLVTQTKHLLHENGQSTGQTRSTIFEGAVREGPFYVRPDIIDKICHQHNSSDSTNRTELRVIEIKSKSYDSRPASQTQLWNANKTIKSSFLPYIQDIAFQSFVVSRAFPDCNVTSWLMMPDRGKKLNSEMKHVQQSGTDVRTVDETSQAIDESTAILLNVDELVATALSNQVKYPGSTTSESFLEVVTKWADQYAYEDLQRVFSETPIGSHCALCEYRIKPQMDSCLGSKRSGFDVCWQEATGLELNDIQQKPLVTDLYGYTKSSINKFISEKKFFLNDLGTDDFQSKKKIESGDSISYPERQLYQVSSLQQETTHQSRNPQYVLKRDSLRREIEKWQYPLHFIDFETASPILPYYPGMAPYEVFAFQFSHHILHEKGALVTHASEYLHTNKEDFPDEQFLLALYNAISGGGTVFQWSSHEHVVLSSMLSSTKLASSSSIHIKDCLSSLLSDGMNPMIDLCKIARDYYYVDGSGGSSSIKRLLAPTLNASSSLKEIYQAPSYNSNNFVNFQWYRLDEKGNAIDPYKILAAIKQEEDSCDRSTTSEAVASGGGAAMAYHEFQCNDDLSEHDCKSIQRSLLRYCELDTLSMAMIVQAWQGFLDSED